MDVVNEGQVRTNIFKQKCGCYIDSKANTFYMNNISSGKPLTTPVLRPGVLLRFNKLK